MVENDKILMREADILRKHGAVDQAVDVYLRIIEEDPGNVMAHVRIAGIYYARRQDNQAAEYYIRAARLLAKRGFCRDAAAIYRICSQVKDLPLDALQELAEIYIELEQEGNAISALHQLLKKQAKSGQFIKAMETKKKLNELLNSREHSQDDTTTRAC